MRAAAPLSVLVLGLCLCGCGCLRSQASSPSEDGPTFFRLLSPEAREARVASFQRWINLALLAAGEKLGPLLFGSGQGSLERMFADGDGDEAGCSKEDGASAKAFMTGKASKWFGGLQAAMDQADDILPGPFATPEDIGRMKLEVQRKMEDGFKDVFEHVKQDATSSCGLDFTSGMPNLATCVHEMTNISRPCIQCGSKFYSSMSSTCRLNCNSSFATFSDSVNEELGRLADDMQSMMKGKAGDISKVLPDAMKVMEQRFKEAGEVVSKGMRTLIPCVECTRQSFDTLYTCMNLDTTWKDDMNKAMMGIEKQLKDARVAIQVGPEPGQKRAQPRQPVVPL